jgi:putative restriction endonuclease
VVQDDAVPSKRPLLDLFLEALRKGGATGLVRTSHPFAIEVERGITRISVRLYIWNVTPGGGARSGEEFRIQATHAEREITAPSQGGQALLLGWDAIDQVFAAFDPAHHPTPSKSASLQVLRATLHHAREHGFASQVRDNHETILAFRDEFLVQYIDSQRDLHDLSPTDLDDLIAAILGGEIATTPIAGPTQAPAATARERVKRTITLPLRASDFRERVLVAYGHQCAVCDVGMDLLDAAHIIPVWALGGSDDTSNGIAFCTLHHRAYDRGLLGIRGDYSIQVSDRLLARLDESGRSHGKQVFASQLRTRLRLPLAAAARPNRAALKRGGQLRGW